MLTAAIYTTRDVKLASYTAYYQGLKRHWTTGHVHPVGELDNTQNRENTVG